MSDENSVAAVLSEAAQAATQLNVPPTIAPPATEGDGTQAMVKKFEGLRAEILAPPKPDEPKAPEPDAPAKAQEPAKDGPKESEPPKEPAATDDAPDPDMKPKVRENFKRLETEKREAVEKLEKATARLKELEGKTVDVEKLKKLEAEHKALSDRLQILDVTQHPKFIEYFSTKFDGIKQTAESSLGQEVAGKLMELLEAPPSRQRNQAISELIPDADDYERDQLRDLAREHDKVKLERTNEIKNAGQYAAKLKEQQAQAMNERKATLEKQFETVGQQLAGKYRLFQTREGDAKWNEQVASLQAKAKELFMGNPTIEDAAIAAHHAAIAPKQAEIIATQVETIAALQEQLRKLQGASPTIPAGAPRANGNGAHSNDNDFVSKFTGVLEGKIPVPGRR